jgi:hypothetical protein
MAKFWRLGLLTVAAFATAAYGGFFRIELPADLTAADVLNPTAAVSARLDTLVREETARHPAYAEYSTVVFTKDREIIYPDRTENVREGKDQPRLTFFPAGEFLNNPGSWAAAEWHLYEAGGPTYNGVYDIAQQVFGFPFFNLDVRVEWDPTILPGAYLPAGYYRMDNDTIYIKGWRHYEDYLIQEPSNGDFHDDAACLTRCMLQAWHDKYPATWDHFGAMRRGAWIAIHNKLADVGYELGFNDLYHDDQRDPRFYYKCLDSYNTEELATRRSDWAHVETSQLYGDIVYWRYGVAGFLWWKVYQKQPDFFVRFNEYLYDEWEWLQSLPEPQKPEYMHLMACALAADGGNEIEGRSFNDWFLLQPMLRCDHWCDDVCALAVDHTKAKVMAYRRQNFNGYEEEVPHSNADVEVKKYRFSGGPPLAMHTVHVNPGGYGEWDFPIHYADEGIKLTATHYVGGGPPTSDARWGIDSDEAYDTDALYGVVTDAVNGGGSVTIKKGGVELATVPVNGCAFRYTPATMPAPGEYVITYTSGRGESRSFNPQKVVKDVASYFSQRGYLSDQAFAGDSDKNGIPDDDEELLAEKFRPEVVMHIGAGKHVRPIDPRITIDRGAIVDDDDNWYRPGPGETMRDLFYRFSAEWNSNWHLAFGDLDRHVTVPDYWDQQWEQLQDDYYGGQTVYYNIFKYEGKPVIQFWFFYPFKYWFTRREGDWGLVNVKISSPDPARAYFEEIVYYFHNRRNTLDDNNITIRDDTHPVVYVGGNPYTWVVVPPMPDLLTGEISGASYWRSSYLERVNIDYWLGLYYVEFVHEQVGPYLHTYGYNFCNYKSSRKAKTNEDAWWLGFPGQWGRKGIFLEEPAGHPSYPVMMDGSFGPWQHECWEVYEHANYEDYHSDDSGPVASSPPSVNDKTGKLPDNLALTPEINVGYRPSPNAGFRPSPTVGHQPSPFGVAPEGGGGDMPGADVPPADSPGLTSAGSSGGDSLSPGAGTSPFEQPGPLVAAAPAKSLTCAPNPVTANATISFELEAPCVVRLAVYDLAGRRVATLAEGHLPAGKHAAYWQADVPTGVYIYRLEASGRVATRKVVVAR